MTYYFVFEVFVKGQTYVHVEEAVDSSGKSTLIDSIIPFKAVRSCKSEEDLVRKIGLYASYTINDDLGQKEIDEMNENTFETTFENLKIGLECNQGYRIKLEEK